MSPSLFSYPPYPYPYPSPYPYTIHDAARWYAGMLIYAQTKRHIPLSKVPKKGATLVALHIDLYSANAACLEAAKCYRPPTSQVGRRVPYEPDTWHLA